MVQISWPTAAGTTFLCSLTVFNFIYDVNGHFSESNETLFVNHNDSHLLSGSLQFAEISNSTENYVLISNLSDNIGNDIDPDSESSLTSSTTTAATSRFIKNSAKSLPTGMTFANAVTMTTIKSVAAEFNESCVSLKCQHGSTCEYGENFVYCNCVFLYTGYNCENALPMYLMIALCICSGIIIIFGITSFVRFIKSKTKKKVAPHVNGGGGHKDKNNIICDNDLYKVDETIYAEPSDFYGGESVKGTPSATNTLPKIPRIGMAKVNLEATNGSSSTYKTFHPNRNEPQLNEDQN